MSYYSIKSWLSSPLLIYTRHQFSLKLYQSVFVGWQGVAVWLRFRKYFLVLSLCCQGDLINFSTFNSDISEIEE